jgi:AcrR family transcriptional regulator
VNGPSGRLELDSRQALIEAMAVSCMERGYWETRVEDLLAATGLSRADFDRHFESKLSCAVAAIEAILAEGIEVLAEAYSADTSQLESTRAALGGLLQLFARRPVLARLAFIDSRQSMPAAALRRYESGFAILTAMLDRLREEGSEAGPPPSTAARAAIGVGEALVRRELAAGRAERLPQLLPTLIYAASVPFFGQAEALRLSRLVA